MKGSSSANVSGANVSGANLSSYKLDFFVQKKHKILRNGSFYFAVCDPPRSSFKI